MRKLMLPALLLGSLLCATSGGAPAHAQTRTWISGVGSDANPCSRTAPCQTLGGAYAKTAVGGIINCIDPGGLGSLTITHSITIDCADVGSSVLAGSGTPGIVINAPGDNVVLRGIRIMGNGGGTIGINVQNVAAVHIEHVVVNGFGNALMFTPPAGVTSRLTATDSSFSDNVGASVNIAPSGTGVARVTFERVAIENNTAGLYIVASSGGNAHVSVKDSSMSGNQFWGVALDTGGGPTQVLISNSVMSNNGSIGVYASGANATGFICCSTISGNDMGLQATGGAGLFTYGNNNINMNYSGNLSGTGPAMQQ